MKNNIKLLYSNFDPDTGISIVRIQTPSGTFKGKARLHPEDKNYASQIAGCQYAEIRATIKYLKHIASEKRAAAEALRKLFNKINQTKLATYTTKKWTKEAYLKEYNDYQACKKQIQYLQKFLKEDIQDRTKAIALLKERTKKNK